MSSIVMSENMLFNQNNSKLDQNVAQNESQSTQSERNLIVERIIAILSENKLNPWVDVGLKEEYRRRHRQSLPDDWIQVLKTCGRDLVEVEVLSHSNGSKTLIQLPIRVARKLSSTAPKPLVSVTTIPVTAPEQQKPVEMCVRYSEPKKSSDATPVLHKPGDRQSTNGVKTEERPVMSTTLNHLEASGVAEDVITGGKAIPAPVLPPVRPVSTGAADDFFDCVVLLAATPSNFIVMPFHNYYSEVSPFVELKRKMLEMYEKDENHIELPPEVIKNGLFVAARTPDGWCRMRVETVVSKNPILVVGYLCDFGKHSTVDLKDIQPLYNVFRDLPAQAIKASLASVEPIGADWEALTNWQFRQMVENKPFVSTVYAHNVVDGQSIISISLCDTTGSDDLYIGADLVAKGMAKAVQ